MRDLFYASNDKLRHIEDMIGLAGSSHTRTTTESSLNFGIGEAKLVREKVVQTPSLHNRVERIATKAKSLGWGGIADAEEIYFVCAGRAFVWHPENRPDIGLVGMTCRDTGNGVLAFFSTKNILTVGEPIGSEKTPASYIPWVVEFLVSNLNDEKIAKFDSFQLRNEVEGLELGVAQGERIWITLFEVFYFSKRRAARYWFEFSGLFRRVKGPLTFENARTGDFENVYVASPVWLEAMHTISNRMD